MSRTFTNLRETLLYVIPMVEDEEILIFLSGYRCYWTEDDLWMVVKVLLKTGEVNASFIQRFLRLWITNHRISPSCIQDIVEAFREHNLGDLNELKLHLIRNNSQKFSVHVTKQMSSNSSGSITSSPARVPPLREVMVHLNTKWSAEIVAKEITTLMRDLLSRVKLQEFTELAWMKNPTDGDEKRPVLREALDLYNQVSSLIMNDILSAESKKDAVSSIKFYLDVAQACLNLHNYDTLSAIISTLQSWPISRLKETWKGLSEKRMMQFNDLKAITDCAKSFQTYRSHVENLKTSYIPLMAHLFVGITHCMDAYNCEKNRAALEENPGSSSMLRPSVNYSHITNIGKLLLPMTQIRSMHADLVSPIDRDLRQLITSSVVLSEEVISEKSYLFEPPTLQLPQRNGSSSPATINGKSPTVSPGRLFGKLLDRDSPKHKEAPKEKSNSARETTSISPKGPNLKGKKLEMLRSLSMSPEHKRVVLPKIAPPKVEELPKVQVNIDSKTAPEPLKESQTIRRGSSIINAYDCSVPGIFVSPRQSAGHTLDNIIFENNPKMDLLLNSIRGFRSQDPLKLNSRESSLYMAYLWYIPPSEWSGFDVTVVVRRYSVGADLLGQVKSLNGLDFFSMSPEVYASKGIVSPQQQTQLKTIAKEIAARIARFKETGVLPISPSSSRYDVAALLDFNDLGTYVHTFLDNEITGSALLMLDDVSIDQLGVKPLGHRIQLKKLLNTLKNNHELRSSASSSPRPNSASNSGSGSRNGSSIVSLRGSVCLDPEEVRSYIAPQVIGLPKTI